MTRQYNRQVSLIVGDAAGNGLDLSALRIKFQTHNAIIQSPNWASIRIYNLAESTVKALKTAEFTNLTLKAGYDGNYGTIFQGTIKYKYKGHESNIDSYLDLICADGDRAYNYSVVNQSLSKGSTPAQHLAAVAKATEANGVTAAPIQPPLPAAPLPRGKVMFGMARDLMRTLAENNQVDWSVQNGKIQLIPQTAYMPGDDIVLTWATGLIGFPEETLNGLAVQCLLNPSINSGRVIKVDNQSVQNFELDVGIQSDVTQSMLDIMKSNDGRYKVYTVEHRGDTRGNDFYTRIICIGVNGAIAPSSDLFQRNTVNPYGS